MSKLLKSFKINYQQFLNISRSYHTPKKNCQQKNRPRYFPFSREKNHIVKLQQYEHLSLWASFDFWFSFYGFTKSKFYFLKKMLLIFKNFQKNTDVSNFFKNIFHYFHDIENFIRFQNIYIVLLGYCKHLKSYIILSKS